MASIYMKSEGHGDHIVFIPGLGGLASFWQPVMEKLKSDYRVSACDHPGMGASQAQGAPSIPAIASAIVGWMDAEQIAQIHVVGHSTGSLVAQTLALDFTSRIKSIVLSSGWARPDQRFRDLFELRKHVLQRIGGTTYSALGQLIAYPSAWYGEHLAKEGHLDLSAPSKVDVVMTCARIDMLLNYSRWNELGGLKLPTLVVGAEDDYVVPFHHSEDLTQLIPGATLLKLNGGHFAPVTQTDAYVERVVTFWELNK